MTAASTRLMAAVVAGVALAAGCVLPSDPPGPDPDAIPIGALLPFTGEAAATGTNIERALIMAVDAVNQAGGIAGRPLAVLSRDTHSDTRRGLEAARALFDRGIRGLIGPEEEDLASRLVSQIRERRIVQIAGGVTSPTFTIADDDGYWFRTNPSSRIYGRALAQRIAADGVGRVAILTQSDEYGTGFASVLVNELVRLDVAVAAPISFDPDQASYLDVLARAGESDPEALVLVTQPRTGAALIQEWAILGGTERWYLAHSLKNQVFIDNIPPGALEGAIGVSVEVAGDAERFAAAFADRWSGDEPLDAAYFYYDAMALMALAIGAAGGGDDGAAIRDQIQAISRPPGRVIAWYELDAGLAALADGEEIDYRGASGEVDLDGFGDLETARVVYWGIEDDRIVDR
jgi:ABC-type branched-subunit amino acid transport system substrate-binding protein